MSRNHTGSDQVFPLKTINPDFQKLTRILAAKEKADMVHFAEILIDDEIIQLVLNRMMGKPFPVVKANYVMQQKIENWARGERISVLTKREEETLIKGYIEFYSRMGYDYIPDLRPNKVFLSMLEPKTRVGQDTAILPKISSVYSVDRVDGRREWTEEKHGLITSWKEFEEFPWDRMNLEIDTYYDFMSENLPEGMKVVPVHGLYETVSDQLLGQEGLYYLLYDQPDLVKAVINEWGKICYKFYEAVLSFECVGAIWHGDDLGHKTGSMISPELLRKLVFPWYRDYSSLAHKHGRQFWVHCCGNVLEIMDDLIEDIKLDVFHSFQDGIIPVGDFQKRYGKRMGILGGVDVDKLCRLNKENLREYVRGILDECMPRGGYALGSGNSITNYIPLENYLAMLEEGLRWGEHQ